MPKERTYSTKDLINTYIATLKPDHSDFTHYHNQLLIALQKAFHVTITNMEGVERNKRAIYMLFQSVIRSFIAIQHPGSRFVDGSLIEKQLEASSIGDEVHRVISSINTLTDQNTKLHWELLELLFNYLYSPINTTITSQELYALGFDDATEPNIDDYEY
jgi:hypothetical protein